MESFAPVSVPSCLLGLVFYCCCCPFEVLIVMSLNVSLVGMLVIGPSILLSVVVVVLSSCVMFRVYFCGSVMWRVLSLFSG